jgi:hypothetical protein
MTTARGRDRLEPGGRRHLVLVRGGLDRAEPAPPVTMGGDPPYPPVTMGGDPPYPPAPPVTMGGDPPYPPAPPEDADWRAFCERIGWQHVEIALPEDYEDQLATRIFQEDAPQEDPASCRRPRFTGVDGSGVAPAGWPGARTPGPSRARRAFAAGAMAVAAVLCAAASVVLWRAARPPVDARACPDVEAPPRATIAPVVDRPAPVDPSAQPRDSEPRSRPPRIKDAPTKPAPRETKPEKPGSLVAKRSRPVHDGAASGARPRGALRRPAESAAVERPAMASGFGAEPFMRAQSFAVAPTLPVIPRAWPDARPASFGQAVVPASASWSLSPTNPRWFGVGLPPSSASAGVPPGIGVMAQLDVGKALAGL